MKQPATTHDGLEGICVADTQLSHVDGDAGVLVLRGHAIEQLATGSTSVEDVCALLWHGRLPDAGERQRMQRSLYEGRERGFALLPQLPLALGLRDAMDSLRAATAHLSEDDAAEAPALLTGAMAVFVAAHERRRCGKPPVAPSPERGQAADFLAMLHGEPVPAPIARALDTYLVTVADHGMSASTFAARVVASTNSDMVSAVVAAIGALKGPLHGGAPGPVLDMLDEIERPERARAWLSRAIDDRKRIMGMGHRVYRVRDPRAFVLERAVRELSGQARDNARLALARAVEDEATALLAERHPDRTLRANVEFFTAVLLEAVGLDRSLFTPTFAVGRVVGWCGHILEQRAKGRLIRPLSRYVGPLPAADGGA
jgi:citrate synthase